MVIFLLTAATYQFFTAAYPEISDRDVQLAGCGKSLCCANFLSLHQPGIFR
jgi:hypothetical protein